MLSVERLIDPDKVALVGSINNQTEGNIISQNIRSSGKRRFLFRILPSYGDMDPSAWIVQRNFPQDIDIAIISSADPYAERYVEKCRENDVRFIFLLASSSGGSDQPENASTPANREGRKHGISRVFGPGSIGIYVSSTDLNLSLISHDNGNHPEDKVFGLIALDCCRHSVVIDEFKKFQPDLGFLLDFGRSFGDRELFSAIGSYLQESRTMLAVTLLISQEGYSASKAISSMRLNFNKPLIVYRERALAGKKEEKSSVDRAVNRTKNRVPEDCVEARDLYDVPDFARAIALNPAMRGKNVSVISTKGATESVAQDYLTSGAFGMHLDVPSFGTSTRAKLTNLLGRSGANQNPITLDPRHRERIGSAIDAIMKDRNTDAILTLITPDSPEIVESLISAFDAGRVKKPVVVALLGSRYYDGAFTELSSRKIAVYPSIRRAITALKALAAYSMKSGTESEEKHVV